MMFFKSKFFKIYLIHIVVVTLIAGLLADLFFGRNGFFPYDSIKQYGSSLLVFYLFLLFTPIDGFIPFLGFGSGYLSREILFIYLFIYLFIRKNINCSILQ